MTSEQLAKSIAIKQDQVNKLGSLPRKLEREFHREIFVEQVYHSSKLEGSTIKRQDVIDAL